MLAGCSPSTQTWFASSVAARATTVPSPSSTSTTARPNGAERDPRVSPARSDRHAPACSPSQNPPHAIRAASAVTSTSWTYRSNRCATTLDTRSPRRPRTGRGHLGCAGRGRGAGEPGCSSAGIGRAGPGAARRWRGGVGGRAISSGFGGSVDFAAGLRVIGAGVSEPDPAGVAGDLEQVYALHVGANGISG